MESVLERRGKDFAHESVIVVIEGHDDSVVHEVHVRIFISFE